MTSLPGCTHSDCSNRAAFKILHDHRLANQYVCFEHIIDHLAREIET